MAIITDLQLANAIRVGQSDEELAIVRRLLAFSVAQIDHFVQLDTPDEIRNEAIIRVAGYLYDAPTTAYANALTNSGAGSILLPYRQHRAGNVDGSTIEPISVPGGGGSVDLSQIADWAEQGNTDLIPISKIPNVPGGGGGAVEPWEVTWGWIESDATREGQRSAEFRDTHAHIVYEANNNTDALAYFVIPDGFGLVSVHHGAQEITGAWDQVPGTNEYQNTSVVGTAFGTRVELTIYVSGIEYQDGGGGSVDLSQIADWAEEGNTDPIPADKLTDVPGGTVDTTARSAADMAQMTANQAATVAETARVDAEAAQNTAGDASQKASDAQSDADANSGAITSNQNRIDTLESVRTEQSITVGAQSLGVQPDEYSRTITIQDESLIRSRFEGIPLVASLYLWMGSSGTVETTIELDNTEVWSSGDIVYSSTNRVLRDNGYVQIPMTATGYEASSVTFKVKNKGSGTPAISGAKFIVFEDSHRALEIPRGGADGQLLAKASADPFDYEWIDAPAGTGGSQITELTPRGSELTRSSDSSYLITDDTAIVNAIKDAIDDRIALLTILVYQRAASPTETTNIAGSGAASVTIMIDGRNSERQATSAFQLLWESSDTDTIRAIQLRVEANRVRIRLIDFNWSTGTYSSDSTWESNARAQIFQII